MELDYTNICLHILYEILLLSQEFETWRRCESVVLCATNVVFTIPACNGWGTQSSRAQERTAATQFATSTSHQSINYCALKKQAFYRLDLRISQ
jgi:hypothetical protein